MALFRPFSVVPPRHRGWTLSRVGAAHRIPAIRAALTDGRDQRGAADFARALTVSAAAHQLPAAHQVRNFSDALIWSLFAPDDGNDLIQQVYFDWVFCARLVHLDQRSSEPIKVPTELATMLLGFRPKLAP
jgi:hypothetical protein